MGKVAKSDDTEGRETFTEAPLRGIAEAAQCSEPVCGLTHAFYRYPARFSPAFARAAILAFSQPGETVLDPFMGGGTTLVEASALGRRGVGTDINPLATFVTTVKTTPLTQGELGEIIGWGEAVIPAVNLHAPSCRATAWAAKGYHRNINDRSTWTIRKILEMVLAHLNELQTQGQRRFARCVLLRTGQWALDCRTAVPRADEFRRQFLYCLRAMIAGAQEYSEAVGYAQGSRPAGHDASPVCLTRSVIGIETDLALKAAFPPALILTSPPYPGVHVLYHRWQVRGRRETPAPFWIVGCADGNGEAYYSFGDRKQQGLEQYYNHLLRAYKSVAQIADARSVLVQLVAFSDPSWQLPKCLSVLNEAGFREVKSSSIANSRDGRVWRSVPHRKWYANQRGTTTGGSEVVLFHRLA